MPIKEQYPEGDVVDCEFRSATIFLVIYILGKTDYIYAKIEIYRDASGRIKRKAR